MGLVCHSSKDFDIFTSCSCGQQDNLEKILLAHLEKYKGAVSAVEWRKDTSGQNNDFIDIRQRKGLTEIHFIKNINSYLDLSILHCSMPALAEK